MANALNVEAATMYEKDIEAFKLRARDSVMDSKEQLYLVKDHPDPHYLIFSSYQDQIHDTVRDKMKQGAQEGEDGRHDDRGHGKSYVATGSLTIFSENIVPGANTADKEGPRSMPK